MIPLALLGAAALAAPAPEPPPGLQPIPLQDVLVGPIPKEMAGCTAAMGSVGSTLSRWLGCGERTVTLLGTPPLLGADVVALMGELPQSLSRRQQVPVAASPVQLHHDGRELAAQSLHEGVGGAAVGLAVAWPDGILQEVGLCLSEDTEWCKTVFSALLSPAREGAQPDPFVEQKLDLLLEPAPPGSVAAQRILQPVATPEGGRMVGCHRYVGMDDAQVERLDCTQGRLVAEPLPAGFDIERARSHLLPYLSLEGVKMQAAGPPIAQQIAGQPLLVAPIEGGGLRGFVLVDPTSKSPRAVGCLDRAPGIERTPWCAVAVESLWGPAAGDVPLGRPPDPPKP